MHSPVQNNSSSRGSFQRASARHLAVVAACSALLSQAVAQPQSTAADLQACLGLQPDSARLACYDRQAGREAMVTLPASPVVEPGTAEAQPQTPAAAPVVKQQSDSFLSRYWELDDQDKRGTFNYTGYRPNVFMPLHQMREVNRTPSSPTRGQAASLPKYKHGEAKIQLSLRSKVLEDVLLPGADLWVAYTQQSMWQLWNPGESAPFRNTDYQPEAIFVVPTPEAWRNLPLGWAWRMSQLGIVHQSNGQPDPLSRSWNRVYGVLGFERQDLVLSFRLEQRLEKDSDERDDNPDIVDYLGRTEVQLAWSPGRATSALTWRPGSSGKGSLQYDWSYPVNKERPDGLRWYVQLFHGFGETLLDYNFRQTSLGLGVTIFKF
ncbi:MAG: phospholipase [Rubrivivax sp.]|nr:MAG: phospholipase [Rubrivivax sp.]